MASQGPFLSTNGFNSGTGEQAWVNPTNIEADDGAEATVTSAAFDLNDLTQFLSGDNFLDFNIPTGATIDGLEFRVKRRAFAGGAVDNLVELFAGLNVSENKATATAWPSTSTEVTYGGPTDDWGRTWTAEEINANNFGGLVQAKATANNTDVGIDYYKITVFYTEGGTTFQQALVATAVGVAVLAAVTTHLRTLAAVAVGVPVLTRISTYLRTLAVVAVGVPVLSKGMFMSLVSVASGVPTLAPALLILQQASATAIGVPTLARTPIYVRLLEATAVGVPTIAKMVSKTLSAIAIGSASMVKTVSKIMAATAVGVAVLDAVGLIIQTLTTVAIGVATMAAQFIPGEGGEEIVRRLVSMRHHRRRR